MNSLGLGDNYQKKDERYEDLAETMVKVKKKIRYQKNRHGQKEGMAAKKIKKRRRRNKISRKSRKKK